MTEHSPTLDAQAAALRLLAAAVEHGYSPGAAYEAALTVVEDLDADRLRQAAAALAGLAARHAQVVALCVDLREVVPAGRWVELRQCQLAAEDPAR
jgi:hypothetical protein